MATNEEDDAGDGDTGPGDVFDDDDPGAPNLVPETGPPARVLPGGIELRKLIGQGGMGQVFLGFHLKLECDVAVKVLDPELELRADSKERLLREGRVLASIRHENIVQVLHCGTTDDDRVFVVMELLEGETLRKLGRREGTLDALEVVRIGMQICRALGQAHEAGVVHRDLTPSNVMILPGGQVKVIDFGVCRVLDMFHARHSQRFAAPPGSRLATPMGVQLGNPEYMAPELLMREPFVPPNACTDVFSVAVVLFELLTGEHPFRPGDRKLAHRVREVMPDFEYLELEQALANALRCDPASRTPTMAALHEDLELAHDCIIAQRGDAGESTTITRAGARLVRLDSFRVPDVDATDEPRERFLAVVPDTPDDEDAAPERPLAAVVALRPTTAGMVPPTHEAGPVTPALAASPSGLAAALVLPTPDLAAAMPSRVVQGWFASHLGGLILGTGIAAGVGATLASQRLGESMFTDPARLAEVEAAGDLCEQELEDTRASLVRVKEELGVARERVAVPIEMTLDRKEAGMAAPTSAPAPTPDPAIRPTPPAPASSVARHRSIRRSLDRVLAEVRECNAEAGGGRLSKLRARIRVEPNGRASTVELVGGSSIAVCVTAAIRGRRYAAGEEAEWIQHDFVLVSREEQP